MNIVNLSYISLLYQVWKCYKVDHIWVLRTILMGLYISFNSICFHIICFHVIFVSFSIHIVGLDTLQAYSTLKAWKKGIFLQAVQLHKIYYFQCPVKRFIIIHLNISRVNKSHGSQDYNYFLYQIITNYIHEYCLEKIMLAKIKIMKTPLARHTIGLSTTTRYRYVCKTFQVQNDGTAQEYIVA